MYAHGIGGSRERACRVRWVWAQVARARSGRACAYGWGAVLGPAAILTAGVCERSVLYAVPSLFCAMS